MKRRLLLILGLLGLWSAACSETVMHPCECACGQRSLRLATTTSVDNTGLLQRLTTPFARRTGIEVHVMAVGTGQALKLAANGDADMVWVHDEAAERAFIDAGHGLNRRAVMHNAFVLVGPKEDPAGVKGASDVLAALRAIAEKKATFVSRGDESGTHKAELRLWKAAGLDPVGKDFYLESGQGQRLNLQVAHEKKAYCLTDEATFLHAQDKLELAILGAGDERLHNPYSVICTHPKTHPEVKYTEAMAFVGFLTGAEGQAIIRDFVVHGRKLFIPDALPTP